MNDSNNTEKSLREENINLWKRIFVTELEHGSNIKTFFEDAKTYFIQQFSFSQNQDPQFFDLLDQSIKALSNYSFENVQNSSTMESLPNYFVFFAEQFQNLSNQMETTPETPETLETRKINSIRKSTELLYSLFDINSKTLFNFPDIKAELGFVFSNMLKESPSKTLLKVLLPFNSLLEEKIVTIINNHPQKQKLKEFFIEIYQQDNSKIQMYLSQADIIELLKIEENVDLFVLISHIFEQNSNPDDSDYFHPINKFMKEKICDSLLLVTERKENYIKQRFIGSLQTDDFSIPKSIQSYESGNENSTNYTMVEAGNQFLISFSYLNQIQKEFTLRTKSYKIVSFIADCGSNYATYPSDVLDHCSSEFCESIVCALYRTI